MLDGMSGQVQPTMTAAYYAQSVISFALSTGSLTLGIAYLPVPPSARALLIMAARSGGARESARASTVRDGRGSAKVGSRINQARLKNLRAEDAPFRVNTP